MHQDDHPSLKRNALRRAAASATSLLLLLGLAALFLGGCKPAPSQAAPGRPELIPVAEKFVDQLVAHDYAAAAGQFDAVMTRAMPTNKLAEAWESLPRRYGPFQRRSEVEAVQSGGFDIVLVNCEFEQGGVAVRVVFDKQGRVTGLWFGPGQKEAAYEPPGYVRPDAFQAVEVTVGEGEWALGGALTLPVGDGPFPAVVLVHGSGPLDRDETVGPNKPFRDLAEGLASRGVAVLRYDKRTKAHQAKMARLQERLTVKEETIDDALAAVGLLKRTPRIDPKAIQVLGHSLGGMLIPRIGASAPEVAGFIVMAGTARPLEDVLLEQVEYVLSLQDNSAAATEKLAELKKQVDRVKDPDLSLDAPAQELPLGVPASYWLDLRRHNPAEEIKSLPQPMLFLQGGRDYQVTEADFNLWKQALAGRDNVQFSFHPDLNHLFASGKGRAVPGEYAQPAHVAEQVIAEIATWVKR